MQRTRISIVGVGDAGCKVVDRLADVLDEDAIRVAVNSDAPALEGVRAAVKLQIGSSRRRGLGAGGDVALGRQMAEEDVEMVRGLFPDVDLAMVIVGLGGGTGTGAAPVVLRSAREAGALTLCFATLPFSFEGRRRRTEAERAVCGLRGAADALIVVPNDRLCESVGQPQLARAFEMADEVLSSGICSICKLITSPGYINLSFADLKQMAKSAEGVCTFGYGGGTGGNKAEEAIAALLGNPLLEQGSLLARAGALLVSIVGDPGLTLKEVGMIMDAVTARAGKDDHILMGTVVDERWQNRLSVTVLAVEGRAVPEPAVAEGLREDPVGAEGDASLAESHQRKQKAGPTQANLTFESFGKGRFKDAEPTILDGEDLDIPTFARRGIAIEK